MLFSYHKLFVGAKERIENLGDSPTADVAGQVVLVRQSVGMFTHDCPELGAGQRSAVVGAQRVDGRLTKQSDGRRRLVDLRLAQHATGTADTLDQIVAVLRLTDKEVDVLARLVVLIEVIADVDRGRRQDQRFRGGGPARRFRFRAGNAPQVYLG